MATDAAQTDNTVCLKTGGTGQLLKGSGAAGICLGTSSARYKHDIADIGVGLDQIMQMRPVKYKLNVDYGDENKNLYGFVAEDNVDILPELVGKDKEGRPNTFDYMGVVPVLVKAIQQQQAEINELRRKLH